MHHLCYGVEDLESHLAFCKSVGTIINLPHIPPWLLAVAA
jgi:hypothetical protein